MPGRLTTHVLDTSAGRPARDLALTLTRLSDGAVLGEYRTNEDGRVDGPLLAGEAFQPGQYELSFHVGDYFRSCGVAVPDPAFLETVPIRFGLSEDSHYHVPLLVSPYGYSTYRGELMRRAIRYLHRGKVETLADFDPKEMLLDHIRLRLGLTGTKEGCNEGDCGACTVALGRQVDGRLVYEPVNACILMTGMIDGSELVTVEDLAEGATLHPLQDALVAHHGSQCGFCTPGIVMSLFTLYQDGARPVGRQAITDRLAGNLCRCTGYRPIVDAALEVCAGEPADRFSAERQSTADALAGLRDGEDVFVGTPDRFFASPASIETLAALYLEHPDAVLTAGATDVGLWVTKQLRDLQKIIWLGRVARLDAIVETESALSIGATVSHRRAATALASVDPDLGELLRRFGSEQVRASGTVGGNVANGSPIGDLPPALIALGAKLYLRQGDEGRSLPLEAFFVDYGRQDRRASEFVVGVAVPRLGPDDHFRCFKVSKRFDEDISAVMAAFRLTLLDGRIAAARVAYGGMAGIPKRAAATEQALAGLDLEGGESWGTALDALGADFSPLTDMRASAGYRLEVARALLTKALAEIAGTSTQETRLVGHRDTVDAS